jgi:hypothetical protein
MEWTHWWAPTRHRVETNRPVVSEHDRRTFLPHPCPHHFFEGQFAQNKFICCDGENYSNSDHLLEMTLLEMKISVDLTNHQRSPRIPESLSAKLHNASKKQWGEATVLMSYYGPAFVTTVRGNGRSWRCGRGSYSPMAAVEVSVPSIRSFRQSRAGC